MSIINSFPTTLVNGTVEDATQVMTLFSWIQSQTNGNACPATGGTSILKGDGLGGTQAASGVTDYTPPTTVRNNALAWLGVDTGAVNVLTFTPATVLVGYVAGQVFEGIIGTSNTGAATINISGVGAVALRKKQATGLVALTAGDLIIGTAHQFLYDGTFVQVLTAGAASGTNNDILQLTALATVPAVVTTAIAAAVPSGTLIDFGGSAAPTGYLLCDGSSYLRATYPALFTAIGVLWGSVDGTHFNVPNFAAGEAAVQNAGTVGASTVGEVLAHTHGVTTGGGAGLTTQVVLTKRHSRQQKLLAHKHLPGY